MRLCRLMQYSDPEGQIFLSAPNNHDRFFFWHIFWSPAFDFNVGVAINKSCSYTLTSAILKVEIDVNVSTSQWRQRRNDINSQRLNDSYVTSYTTNVLTTFVICFFIYPTGRLRVFKVRFVSTGENRGKPCLVCKNPFSWDMTLIMDFKLWCLKTILPSMFVITLAVEPHKPLPWLRIWDKSIFHCRWSNILFQQYSSFTG